MVGIDAVSTAVETKTDLLTRTRGSHAPVCEKCAKPLDVIDVLRYPGRWEWNAVKRVYDIVTLNPAEVYVCPHCKAVVGGRYGNGSKWGFEPPHA